MNINIRQISTEHSEEYFNFRVISEKEYPEYVGFSAERELLAGADGINDILALYPSEGTCIFGAFDEKQLVGVIAVSRRLSPKYLHRAFIWGMYIHPQFRRYDVGALLLKHAIAWAKETESVNILWLQVTTINEPAIRFYKKYGFSIYGTEKQALCANNEMYDAHYMEYVI